MAMDANTISLMHFDGNLIDETGRIWTPNGGISTGTGQSKFGGSSLLCGNLKTITTPMSSDLNFGIQNFTVEWWEYLTNSNNTLGDCFFAIQASYTGTYRDWETDRKSTRLNSSHLKLSRMPSSA